MFFRSLARSGFLGFDFFVGLEIVGNCVFDDFLVERIYFEKSEKSMKNRPKAVSAARAVRPWKYDFREDDTKSAEKANTEKN